MTASQSKTARKTPAKKTPAKSEFEPVVVHFVEDGLVYGGNLWYRGQELWFNTQEELDATYIGKYEMCWPLMNDGAQMKRFGHVKYRLGPWPGERWEGISEEDYLNALTPQQREAIDRYKESETRKGGPPKLGKR